MIKRITAIIMAMMLMLAFTACGGSSSDEAAADEQDIQVEESDDTAEEDIEEEESESESAILSPEFKETMDDYEAWFDHYCEVMKKYEENPSDMELLSEMTDLLTEETEMLEKMENMDQSEMNTAELAYYLEVTARIEKKRLEVGS